MASVRCREPKRDQDVQHGLSLFGDIKYPEGFKHFDYVNPRAPQGGTVRLSAFGTFDNFNTVVAGVKGSIAAGSELFIETLMTPALDEVSTAYGLLAESRQSSRRPLGSDVSPASQCAMA